MKKWRLSSLFWQIYASFILIMMVPLVLLTFFTVEQFRKEYLKQTISAETTRAKLIGTQIASDSAGIIPHHVDSLCKSLSTLAALRITVVSPDGTVIGDSDADPKTMENHKSRPEILDALDQKTGISSRFSHTIQKDMLYVAIPLYKKDVLIGVVRTAVPMIAISFVTNNFYQQSLIIGLVLALLTAIISIFITNGISQPIRLMQQGAQRIADGDFSVKLGISRTDEIGELAEALGTMAKLLHDRIRTITRQSNEREAVLSSMTEGVIALETSERVININHAAATLLGIAPDQAIGRLIHETTRNSDIQKFVSRALAATAILEAHLEIPRDGEIRYIQAHGSTLRDHQNRIIGALIVLNDVTRQHKLENVRRDFVANVSHELRTPLTSIKGFVETLSMGALEPPEDARRFLTIIAGQVDRLNSIIEDLLTLSWIEKENEMSAIVLSDGDITTIFQNALAQCTKNATAKNITLILKESDQLTGRVNSQLLEQAIVNLIDNAIKYSNSQTTVTCSITATQSIITLAVADQGIGIPANHRDRIFERFYRVDKARSQKLGGTGLGLSIVKHIIAAHGGTVVLESTEGKGSIFSIQLPRS